MMNTQIILDQNVLAEISAAAVVGVSDAVHEMIGEKELDAGGPGSGRHKVKGWPYTVTPAYRDSGLYVVHSEKGATVGPLMSSHIELLEKLGVPFASTTAYDRAERGKYKVDHDNKVIHIAADKYPDKEAVNSIESKHEANGYKIHMLPFSANILTA